MEFNFLIIVLASLVPLIIGAIWYNPKVFGSVWMKANGFEGDYVSSHKMWKIMILSFIFNFFTGDYLNLVNCF